MTIVTPLSLGSIPFDIDPLATPQSTIVTALFFDTIYERLSHLQKGTSVILDVDNTLFFSEDDEFCMKYSFEDGADQYNRFLEWLNAEFKEKAPTLLCKAFSSTQRKLTNEKWPELLRRLAAQEVTVIRLTAVAGEGEFEGITNAESRIETEKALGLNFSALFSYPEDSIVPVRYASEDGPREAMIKEGEIFCACLPKEKVLENYWEEYGFPEAAVVVDDHAANVIPISDMCLSYGVKCTPIYYRELAEKFPGPFDEELAKFKFHVLDQEGEWLCDSQAKLRMELLV
jgi:hypothetical protein